MLPTVLLVIIIGFVSMAKLHTSPIDGVADDTLYRYRMSLDNRTRLITTIFVEPFMMLKYNRNRTLSEAAMTPGTILDPSMVEGYCADLANVIFQEKLKIPYKFVIETKYGNEIKKRVWDGMTGALVNHTADLAIALLPMTAARGQVMDFSQPFINSGISLMFRKPGESMKLGPSFLLLPFSSKVWFSIIVSYILVSIILCCINRLLPYEWYFENEKDMIPRNKFSVHNALLFSFGRFKYQDTPSSISGRVVTGVWWLFSLIFLALYVSNLAAFSNLEKLETPIETVEDLVKRTDIQYGLVKDSSVMAFFNKSKVNTYETMWNFMQHHKDQAFVLSNQQGIRRVREGGFAFFLESTINDYVNGRLPCDTIRMSENINTEDYGIATPLGSDLREAINIAVVELAEIGFLKQLKQKWFNERSECTSLGTKHEQVTSVFNFDKVAGIFFILFVGLSIAILIALCEFLVKTKRDSTRLNQNMCKVLGRNLCIAIKGMTLDEKKEAVNNWLLQQQSISLPYRQNMNENERPVTTVTAT